MEGWIEEEAWGLHKLSLTHTHTLLSLPWCPSSLDPSSFWISLSLHLLGAIQWNGDSQAPSPHLIHTQPYTLNLKFSHSHAPRCCISQLTVNHPLPHGRDLVQNAEMCLSICNIRNIYGEVTLINCGVLLVHVTLSLFYNIMYI